MTWRDLAAVGHASAFHPNFWAPSKEWFEWCGILTADGANGISAIERHRVNIAKVAHRKPTGDLKDQAVILNAQNALEIIDTVLTEALEGPAA